MGEAAEELAGAVVGRVFCGFLAGFAGVRPIVVLGIIGNDGSILPHEQ
jgi:hypothetical protein